MDWAGGFRAVALQEPRNPSKKDRLAVGGESIVHHSLLKLLSNSELVDGVLNGNHGGRKTYRLRRRDFESILKS